MGAARHGEVAVPPTPAFVGVVELDVVVVVVVVVVELLVVVDVPW